MKSMIHAVFYFCISSYEEQDLTVSLSTADIIQKE
jgi:hypothetical protein